MRMRIATLLTLVLVAAAVILGLFVGDATLPFSLGSPAPTRALLPEPSRSPAPPVETVAPDALRVFSVGAMPSDYRFVLVGDAGDERLLLLDLAAKRVKLVAHFEGMGAFETNRVIETTSTASGETLVIHLRSDRPTARVYVINPATAEVRSFTTPRSEQPRLSPDAATLAVSRNSDDPAENGLWLLNTTDGSAKRLTTDVGRRATRAVQWSSDGTRLAALLDPLDFKRELVVVDIAGNSSPSIGPASDARWRGGDLLYWNATVAGPVSVYSATGGSGVTYPAAAGVIVDRAEVRPRSTDLALRQHTASSLPVIVVYDSSSGLSTVKVDDAQLVLGFWWSPDGSHLYAWSIDNGTTTVRDLLSGTTAVTFCFRKQIEPPCG